MSVDSQGGELEVTPEEKRFLKRFFRRQMLPWFALLLVIGITSGWWFEGDDASDVEARTSAALAQLRTENQRLHQELVALREDLDTRLARSDGGDELERRVEDAKQNVRMIEARVTAALERRISALESRESAPTRAAPAAPPPDASAWDVSTILDRLYALEMRQDQEASARERTDSTRGARLARLEARVTELEGGAVPASAP